MRKVVVAAMLACTFGLWGTSHVHAGIFTPCNAPKWTPNGAQNRIIVDVYLDPTLAAYLGISQNQLNVAVAEATAIWNEQSSGGFALRWKGAPPAGVSISSLHAFYVWHNTVNACGGGTLMKTGGVFGDNINIDVRKYSDLVSGQCVNPIAWQFSGSDDPSIADFVSKLVHEFGHAASVVGNSHPGEAPCPPTFPGLPAATQQSIMDQNGVAFAGRVMRPWDQHRIANLYGRRASYSSLQYRLWNNATSQWGGVTTAVAAPSYFSHRVSVSQGSTGNILMEWDDRSPTLYKRATVGRWNGTFIANSIQQLAATSNESVEMPGAVALDPINGRAIAVYLRQSTSQYNLPGDNNKVYYRLSTNSGSTYGPEIDTGYTTRRPGVSAGFDPTTQRFIIAFAKDPQNIVQFLTLPSAGGALYPTAFSTLKSWDPPSIACRAAPGGCRFLYRTLALAIDVAVMSVGSSGAISSSGSVGIGYYGFGGPPAISWSEPEQKFHIAFLGNFGAIYSGTLGPTGTTFTGTPDIFNNQAVPVSIPALATTTLLSYAWFVRWW